MIRKSFVMQLHPDKVEEYEQRHNPIWPELEALLLEHGVCRYSIFHNQGTNQLFAYAEIASVERWNLISDSTICRKWWEYMRTLMDTNEDGSPKATDLREVFHIDAVS